MLGKTLCWKTTKQWGWNSVTVSLRCWKLSVRSRHCCKLTTGVLLVQRSENNRIPVLVNPHKMSNNTRNVALYPHFCATRPISGEKISSARSAEIFFLKHISKFCKNHGKILPFSLISCFLHYLSLHNFSLPWLFASPSCEGDPESYCVRPYQFMPTSPHDSGVKTQRLGVCPAEKG